MDVAVKIVTAMAFQATRLAPVASGAPLLLGYGTVAMLVFPIFGVDIAERQMAAMAHSTVVFNFAPVVAFHAEWQTW